MVAIPSADDIHVMGILAPLDDVTRLPEPRLNALLAQHEQEERTLSRRRNSLHERIDFVRAGGFASADPTTEPLDDLLEAEREISARRHAIHQQIDELRAEQSRRRAAR
jgi:anti-sigma-K factor RsiG